MTCVANKDAAITLAHEVCSDDILASLPHPCEWSKESVIDYILTEETMKTAVDGRYCGELILTAIESCSDETNHASSYTISVLAWLFAF